MLFKNVISYHPSIPVVLSWGLYCSPEVTDNQHLEIFLTVKGGSVCVGEGRWRVGAVGVRRKGANVNRVETRAAAKHPTMHRMALHDKELSCLKSR